MSIKLYILNKDGSIKHERVGDVDSVMLAVEIENLDFTLTPPPSYAQKWYWYDKKWHESPAT
ncbi:hypothetical protein [Helicobacter pylori]|uniref:hypothetical protein n=1 Tax=Helicobacter pylori TaxID=210 RepID=UPI002AC3BF26|nr:hypothetical protein [Helicobacter pylori]MDZ5288554.1 hypothetical protein [Helicobacter pylori]